MHNRFTLVVATAALAVVVLAGAAAIAAPERKSAAPVPATPTSPLTMSLKKAQLYWECPAGFQGSPDCLVDNVVEVTLVDGFVIVTQDSGARTFISRERLLRLRDTATLAEKP